MILPRLNIDKYLPPLLHMLGWFAYILMVYIGNASRVSSYSLLVHQGLGIVCQGIIFYANFIYLLPFIFKRIRLISWIFINLLLIVFLSAFFVWVQYAFNYHTTLSDRHYILDIFIRIINNVAFLGLAMIIRFSIDWFKQKYNENELENKTLKTELAFLKTQINPHFLFNALNNLYALSLKNSPEAPQSILQISKIMRYLLYETNDSKVQLSKEIEIIQDYIALQQLKSKIKTEGLFTITGDSELINIEPLLLLPLVENVFKHGAAPMKIQLTITSKTITFGTVNLKKTEQKTAEGIGLQNLKRRLELLYPDQYQLDIDEKEGNFIAEMIIQYKS
ncbi:sensor histidine kinase [Daejeonella sp.]|uniref:sensor histidine kinase n=1 Tax=Daejeonella sp. TaxID=2805397 RepID=UPI002727F523|nr:sensor histidine kinase [Daejeonella sp.]MDO8994366.1 histidine kinase [Daejeonella sp.]MDP2413030.1 histidine kinase [Daejeonella sp.]